MKIKMNMAIINFVSMILHYYIQQNNRWTNQSIFSTKNTLNRFKIKNTLNMWNTYMCNANKDIRALLTFCSYVLILLFFIPWASTHGRKYLPQA